MPTTHTKGPWSYRKFQSGVTIFGNGQYPHAEPIVKIVGGDTKEDQANARLIASAPALYAALQLAVQSMEDALSNGPQWAENMEKADLPTIREALHQAEGGIP